MPGSRSGELKRMLPLFEQVANTLATRINGIEFVLPAVEAHAGDLARQTAKWRVPARIVSAPDDKDAAFRTARLAIVKSGTGTLELALAGVPMVATYQVSGIEAFVARRMLMAPSAVRGNLVPSVILANLVLDEMIVPELLQEDATAEKIVAAALPLFEDSPQRRRQIEAFKRLDDIMEIGRLIPSERAGEIVLNYAARKAAKP
jgi:lipid-A-disaccharide synthase